MKIVVKCSQGHRFPVNLRKNKNRPHVFCPECREKVIVRKKHVFSPDPNWQEEKERRRQDRLEIKERRGKTPPTMFPQPVGLPQIYLSPTMMKLLQKEKERKLKNERSYLP